MILINKFNKPRSYFLSFFFVLVLIPAILTWNSCSSGGDNQQEEGGDDTGVVEPPPEEPDPLDVAMKNFREVVWPFFQNDRCVNCHDFLARKNGITASHNTVDPIDDPSKCIGCHGMAASGNPGFAGWVEAPGAPPKPVTTKWKVDSDPDEIRGQIIAGEGADLYNHLIGEGADKDPFVQWCFFDAPDNTNANPPGPIKSGALPGPKQLQDNELMMWEGPNGFKLTIQKWICLEEAAGNDDLGKPPEVDCSTL